MPAIRNDAAEGRPRARGVSRTPAHAAIEAWRSLSPDHMNPVSLEILKEEPGEAPKSAVYSLVGGGPEGENVIGKRSLRDTSHIEKSIYEHILPGVSVPSLRYFGFVEESERIFCWIFIEFARGEAYQPDDPEHRRAAAEWLGALHTSAASMDATSELPDRGPTHYLDHLRSARHAIELHLGDATIERAHREFLKQLIERLNRLENQWHRIEEQCHTMPQTLVHGDIASKNARISTDRAVPPFRPFDWETAGKGPVFADLSSIDIPTYWSVARRAWPDLTLETVESSAVIGRLFRYVAAIDWETTHLEHGPITGNIVNLKDYDTNLSALIHSLRI